MKKNGASVREVKKSLLYVLAIMPISFYWAVKIFFYYSYSCFFILENQSERLERKIIIMSSKIRFIFLLPLIQLDL